MKRSLAYLLLIFALLSTMAGCGGDEKSDADDTPPDNGEVTDRSVEITEGLLALEEMNGDSARLSFLKALEAEPLNCEANFGLALANVQMMVEIVNGLVGLLSAFFPDIWQMTGIFSKENAEMMVALQFSYENIIANVISPIDASLREITDSMMVVRTVTDTDPAGCKLLFDFPIDLSFLTFLGIETEYQFMKFGSEWDVGEANLFAAGAGSAVGVMNFLLAHDLSFDGDDMPTSADYDAYGPISFPVYLRNWGEPFGRNNDLLGQSYANWFRMADAQYYLTRGLRAAADLVPDLDAEVADGSDPQEDEVFGLFDYDGNGLDSGDVVKIGMSELFGLDTGDGLPIPLPRYFFNREAVVKFVAILEKFAAQMEAVDTEIQGPAAAPFKLSELNELFMAMQIRQLKFYNALSLDIGAYFQDVKPFREYLPIIYDNFECDAADCKRYNFLFEIEHNGGYAYEVTDTWIFGEDAPHFSDEYGRNEISLDDIIATPKDCVAPSVDEYIMSVYLPDPSFNGMIAIDVNQFPFACESDRQGYVSGNYEVNKLVAAYMEGYIFSETPFDD
jgi:hypothetical protein